MIPNVIAERLREVLFFLPWEISCSSARTWNCCNHISELDGNAFYSYTEAAMAPNMFQQLRRRVNRLLLDHFSRKPEPGSLVRQRWESSFTEKERQRRFEEGGDAGYRAAYEDDSFAIELKKPDIFAWADDRLYRFDDFTLELSVSLPRAESMSSAGGLIVRKADEDTFYYFLISDTGMFRFDFVFNGHPRTLIPWTSAVSASDRSDLDTDTAGDVDTVGWKLKLIARGTDFTFFINDAWVAEVEDDGARSGTVSLAAQRYHDSFPEKSVPVRFHSLLLESRPMEVEIEYLRWTKAIKAAPEQRVVLARRLFDFGNYGPALVQLKRAFTVRQPFPEEELLIAECCLRLGFYESALHHFEELEKKDPGLEEACLGKANVLYLQNRFSDLMDYLDGLDEPAAGRPSLLNLRGNTLSALGNFSGAAACYREAFAKAPEMAIFGLNAAAALENAGAPEASEAGGAGVIELYRECSRILFRQEAWEDLDRALTALRRRDPSDPVAESIEGKIAFQDGDYELAATYLRPLADAGYDDSTVHYLCALIDLQAGDQESAFREAGEACRLEPDYPLYRFKRAEIAYLLGRADPEEAREAVRLDEENGWAWNLLGLILLEGDGSGDVVEALDALGKAADLLPEEPEPLINRSAALMRTEGADAALASLDAPEFTDRSGACTSAAILNRKGNILSEAGRYEEASQAYLAAAALEPGEPLWRENAAAALLAADRVPEADRLLARLLEEEATASRYRLTGQSALRTGEYSRAEAAFKAALQADPEDPMCRLDLVEMHLLRERFSEADKTLESLEAEPQAFEALTRRMEFLRRRLRTTGGTEYGCAGCSRIWWVPKDAAAPEQLRLRGEPPAEAPAGQCPSCGAVYCVACGMEHLSEGRFHCPACEVPLKLNDSGLRYLMMKLVDSGTPPETQP